MEKINFNAELMTGNTKRNTVNSRERTNEELGVEGTIPNYYRFKCHNVLMKYFSDCTLWPYGIDYKLLHMNMCSIINSLFSSCLYSF